MIEGLVKKIKKLDTEDRIDAINQLKIALSEVSPLASEPVDCVIWVNSEDVFANDYNPNAVAPPEMKLLEHSIEADGYTQPIVTHRQGEKLEVVDGFHRNRVGKECGQINSRIHNRLPVVVINSDRAGKGDRIAATIRHNRARGKHKIDAMSEIVADLAKRNWSNKKIGKELGMDPDEVLRLKQITGLAELFADKEFSEAWEIED